MSSRSLLGHRFICTDWGTGKPGTWLEQRVKATKACLELCFVDSALTLLYSAIDTLGFLGAPDNQQFSSGDDFIAWCDRYLIPQLDSSIGVQAIDLWGARCGVLHATSAASRLGWKGQAREIWYRFRGRDGVNLMLNASRPPLFLEVEPFVSAFEKSGHTFLAELSVDAARLAVAQQRAAQFFSWGILPGVE